MSDFSYKRLYKKIVNDATVNIKGIHGAKHWTRVMRNGMYIAEHEHLPHKVIKCFALLHDSRRLNDGTDPMHGPRAADYAAAIRDTHLVMAETEFSQLVFACRYHTNEQDTDDIIVHACWDADRLDLGRIGITPDPAYLKTNTAKNIAKSESFYLLEDYKTVSMLLSNQ